MSARRDFVPFRRFPVDQSDRVSALVSLWICRAAFAYIGLQLLRAAL